MNVYGWVLKTLVTVMAPITPFLSERVFQNLTGTEGSVHHTEWPEVGHETGDKGQELEGTMQLVREICALGHAKRKEAKVPVRQPLKQLQISNSKYQIEDEYKDLQIRLTE